VMPWWIFVFVSSSSHAGVSPVRVAARSPVAGWWAAMNASITGSIVLISARLP
jgi:hypothetical protein